MIKKFYFYNRKYSIDDQGNVIRLAFKDIRIQKYNGKCVKLVRHNKEKLLKLYINKDGYAEITLHYNSKQKTFLLHHLVYLIFVLNITNLNINTTLGYKDNFKQINHKDGDKLNNSPYNLELISLQENIQHAIDHKIHNSQTKAVYIEIYKDNIYLTTVWKFKEVSKYLYKYFHKYINTGTLCSYCKQGKAYQGFTFKYKV